ncbi:MAG: DUF3810 domain-containing protein [Flavobacteriales bacterium]|nr:DUF3810 domain-containing protein [Flavobacteriales bacterium]
MKQRVVRFGGVITLILALLIRTLFLFSAEAFDLFYFNSLFPLIRKLQYPFGSLLPISGYYIIIFVVLAWVIYRIPKSKKSGTWRRFFRRLINFLCGWAACFLFLWGFNYVGPSLADRMKLMEVKVEYDVAKLYISAMEEAASYRKQISLPNDSASVDNLELTIDYQIIDQAVKGVLNEYDYPTNDPVKVRKVQPFGALRRLGIRGIYNPFTGEANVESDAGLVTALFTAAHEMAHAYGVTSEGEANLTAYIALIGSEDPHWKYSAAYHLWRYTAREVNQKLPEEDLEILAAAIPKGLQIDRNAIWARGSKQPAYFPKLSEKMNDTYLKVQGVKAGTDDYSAFVKLYLEYYQPSKD